MAPSPEHFEGLFLTNFKFKGSGEIDTTKTEHTG